MVGFWHWHLYHYWHISWRWWCWWWWWWSRCWRQARGDVEDARADSQLPTGAACKVMIIIIVITVMLIIVIRVMLIIVITSMLIIVITVMLIIVIRAMLIMIMIRKIGKCHVKNISSSPMISFFQSNWTPPDPTSLLWLFHHGQRVRFCCCCNIIGVG